jgi:bisphosphoglycerate-independent phosphoglycerate mutase (AlkP superfamily)
VSDILNGLALHHDFTNTVLRKHGETLPYFTPRQAGHILAGIAKTLDFALFEYFLTDLAGHAQDPTMARQEVKKVEGFLEGLLESVDLRHTQVLICSDHGNLEDLSVRTHTRNPVPTLLWGPLVETLASNIESLEHIAPQVLRVSVTQREQTEERKT